MECRDTAADLESASTTPSRTTWSTSFSLHTTSDRTRGFTRISRSFDLVANQPELPALLERARAQDVGVVAMKTLMGARLNDLRPYETSDGTFAQAAFRWVLSNPNVDTLIISMKSVEMIDEYLGASGSGPVRTTDLELLERYASRNSAAHCRQGCNGCAGACPHGVAIPEVLRTRTYATDYEDLAYAREDSARADSATRTWAAVTRASSTSRSCGSGKTDPKRAGRGHGSDRLDGTVRGPDCATEPVRIVPSNPSSQIPDGATPWNSSMPHRTCPNCAKQPVLSEPFRVRRPGPPRSASARSSRDGSAR